MRSTQPATKAWLIAAGLVLLTVAVYLPVNWAQFVEIDDWGYVYQNPRISGGLNLKNLLWFCTHSLGGNWHPLTALSHMLDCQIFGLNPRFHHWENVLFHGANVVLLFFLVRRFDEKKDLTVMAWLVAALFAVHPLHVESVAWVSERKDVLSAFFFLLTLHAYFPYGRQNNRRAYYLSLLWFALGLMSKPMIVTLPCVLLLLDYWPLQRTGWKQLVLEKWPFFLLSVLDSIFTLRTQISAGAMNNLQELGFASRISNTLVSYWFYLVKFFIPTHLTMFYPQEKASIGWLCFIALVFVTLTVVAIIAARRQRAPLVGWLWFLGMLVPISGILQTGSQGYADRYSYLPSIGLSLAIIWPLTNFVLTRKRAVVWTMFATTCALAGFVTLAQTQVGYWQNTEVLYSHALSAVPNNREALVHYGGHFEEIGLLDKASQCYSNALAVEVEGYSLFHLGKIYQRKKNISAAQDCYEAAFKLAPDRVEVSRALGRIYDERGMSDKAFLCFSQAVSANPDYVDGLRDFAWMVASEPKISATNAPRAIECAQHAVLLEPENFVNYAILAGALARGGKFPDAIQAEEQAITLARAAGNTNIVARCEKHLALFKDGKIASDK